MGAGPQPSRPSLWNPLGSEPPSPAPPATSRPPCYSPNSCRTGWGLSRTSPRPYRSSPGRTTGCLGPPLSGPPKQVFRESGQQRPALNINVLQRSKKRKERKVFWKHLMCQLIKRLIINKLPPRGRGKTARFFNRPRQNQTERASYTKNTGNKNKIDKRDNIKNLKSGKARETIIGVKR